ncbi:gliding motility-associated C-terminal domain-containing protein [bacterium]|nr:gliding motility-associated C-terminal domain-containing protein [bacterium]
MKITLRTLFTLFILFHFFPSSSKAAHIVGVDLVYRCINPVNQTFEIDITLYRDCAGGGAGFDNNITIFAFRSLTGALQATTTAGFPGFSTPVVPANWTNCSAQPYTLCVEVATYTTTITLPPRAGGYDIGWARCCRNGTITNLTNPGAQGITVTSHIPGTNEATGCNNSAVFNQVAPQFLCANEMFSFNHSATDVDGDSLVYSVCNPFTGTNFGGAGAGGGNPVTVTGANPMGPPPYNNVPYMAPFSHLDPFRSGNFMIDPQSGLLTLVPPQIGQFVFAICVQEYRNGILINETKRDFQINVINCINQGQPPVTTNTAPLAGNFSNDTLYIDPGDPICYNVGLAGAIATDTVILFPVSAIFGIGGSNIPPPLATLTFGTANPAVGLVAGTVCWASNCDHQGDTIRFIVGGNNISDCFGFNIAYDTVVVVISGGADPQLTSVLPGGGNTVTIDPNQAFCYTFDVTDPDVIDTLIASLANGPFGSTNVPTISYTGTRPITGQVCWTPTCADEGTMNQFVIAARDTNYCPQQQFAYDTITISVNALPRVDISPRSASLCFGDSVRMRAIVANPGSSYIWSPNTKISNTTIADPWVTPDITTTYTVNITDSYGCPHIRSSTITVDTIPIVTISPDTFNCPGDSVQLLAGGGGTYVWTPNLGLSDPNIGNPMASPNDTTTYTVTVTNSGNCSASDSVNVATMNIAISPSPVLCPGDSVQLFATGGVTYSWAPSATLINANTATPTAFPAVTTTYVVTVTDINNCVDTDTTIVNVNLLPVVTISNDTTLCAGDAAPLFATGGVSYAWTPALGLNTTTSRTPVATPATTTRYIVTVTDANTCTNTDSVDITVNQLPPVFAGNDTVKCGNIGVPLNATGAVTYVWTPITGLSNPNIGNPIANPAATTLYTVTGTDANGCSNTDQVNVMLFDGLVDPDVTICIGDTVQITASGGVSYSWNNGGSLSAANIANPLAFPTVTTQYIVDIFHVSGCFDADTINVNVNPLPITTISNDTAVCAGDMAPLFATGGISYSWTPAGSLSNANIVNPVATPATTTDYIVTVTDANTCSKNDTVRITVNPLPPVFAGNDTTKCGNVGVPLNATGAITYVWTPIVGLSNPNIANPIANPNATTVYTVTGTDANGCINTDQINVILFEGTVGPDVTICIGDTTQLNAFNGSSYAWNNGATLTNTNTSNPRAFPSVTTSYIVDIFHPAGCFDPDTITVFVNPLPVVTVSNDTAICIGQNTPFLATGGTSYAWAPGGTLSNAGIANPTATPGATTTYVVTATDANTCQDTDSVQVTINPLPIVFAGNDTTKCGNIGVPLNATGAVTYVWTPIVGLSNPNIANPIANPNATTLYTVTGTDANGCVNTDQINVILFEGTVGPDVTICESDTTQLSAFNGSSYVWNNAATLTNANIANPRAFPTVTTQYIVNIFHPVGCFDADTVNVTVLPQPNIITHNDTAICIGDTIPIFASGGAVYVWTADPSLASAGTASTQVFPVTTTTYYVSVTGANGCSDIDSVTITVNALPIISAGNDTAKCGNVGVQLTATGGIAYVWTPAADLNNPNIASPVANPAVSTTYYVVGTNANQCSNIDSVFMRVMYADAGVDLPVCIFDSVQLNASGGVSYSWIPIATLTNPNISNPFAFPVVNTDYIVTVTDITGCMDIDTVSVTVNPLPVTSVSQPFPYVCSGGATPLTATGGATYIWDPSPTLANLNIFNPIANPVNITGLTVDSTWYFVTVIDSNGCRNNDSIGIEVRLLPIITAIGDTNLCPGDSIQLFAGGGVGYSWFPSRGLSDPNIANPFAKPDTTLIYGVSISAIWGCTDTLYAQVYTLYPEAGPDQVICLNDTAQIMGGGGSIYSWTPVATLSNPNIASPRAFPLITTTYMVTITDSLGCVDTDSMVVTVLPLPPADAGPTDSICLGFNTQLNASGGIGFQWDPEPSLSNLNLPNPVATPGITTTYYVNVTGTNGCSRRDSVEIIVYQLPIADAGIDQAICIGDTTILLGAGSINFAWVDGVTLNDTTFANPRAFPTATTDYILTVTDIFGCIDDDTVQVVVNPLPIADAGANTGVCFGLSTVLNATGGVTYQWDPQPTLTPLNVFNPTATPADTTTYFVTVTDTNTCVNRDSVTVDVYPLPFVDAGQDTAICFGLSTQLNGSGGVSYQWLPDPTLSATNVANPIATPLVTTTYYLAATDFRGCINIDSVLVTVLILPIADAGPDDVICIGDSAQFNGAGGFSYLWDNGATLSDDTLANPMASPPATTSYILTVLAANGCPDTDTINLTVNPLPNADAGPNTGVCFGLSTVLNATGGAIYQWDSHPTLNPLNVFNPTATSTDTTTYFVTVTDTNTCVNRDSVTVDVYPLPIVDAGQDTAICFGLSTQLNAIGGVAYNWLPDPTLTATNIPNPVATPVITTKYYVAVTDFRGCINVDSVEITVNQLPRSDAGPDDAICLSDSAQLNGAGGLQYLWDNTGTLSDDTLSNPMASPMVTTDYVLTVFDINGCEDTDTMTLTVNPIPTADAGPTVVICENETTQLNATGGIVYIWDPTPFLSNLMISDPMATPDSTRIFYVTVTDDKGCTDRDSVTVLVNLLPPVFAGLDTGICIGENVTLQASGGSTYAWDIDPTLSATNIANPVATPTSTTTYFVTGTDAAGCVNRDEVTVTVNPLPNIATSVDTTICEGFAAPLRATGGVSYIWAPAATLDDPNRANPFASPITTTIYTVTGTDANGCVNTDDVMIMVIPAPTAEGIDSFSICKFQLQTMTVSGGDKYLWSTGSTSPTITVSPLTTTTFWVIPYGDNNCPGDTFYVTVYVEENLPMAIFEPGVTEGFYPLEVPILNLSENATRYRWRFGDGETSLEPEPIHTFNAPGQYVVTLVVDNEIGCPDSTTFEIIDAWDYEIYFPNAFTPNGDSKNDEFFIPSGAMQTVNINIFDRWGALVYASSNPEFRWDGTKNGQNLPEGVYTFHVRATTFAGEVIERGGTVTLIR